MEPKPLTPISSGIVLIVGCKPSNFDDEIKTHPRVIMWSSQNENWSDKEIPSNTRAVFVTRWIGHNAFAKILNEARKKHITMFNPEGTGMIAKQVRELLAIHRPQEIKMETQTKPVNANNKLHQFIPFIDWAKNNTENAKVLMVKVNERGLSSTPMSLANFVGQQRKKLGLRVDKKVAAPKPTNKGLDVSVQMLDDAIQSLKDMRAFLVATTEENKSLKMKLDRFRKMIEE